MPERTLLSRLIDALVRRIAHGLRIPGEALRMFRTANALSGLDRSTLPTELIPLNTIQLSRGLLNFTVLQSLDGWVLPFWAERQYDPSDPGFVPRSHLGLSINVSRRNWTAVGAPGFPAEPVVDPRGAVMPFRNRWSIEPWLKTGGTAYYPSRAAAVRQRVVDGLPVVATLFECGPFSMEETVYVTGSTLAVEVSLTNNGPEPGGCEIAFAVRPFNPEGACLLGDIRLDGKRHALILDGTEKVILPGDPSRCHFTSRHGGDSAVSFEAPAKPDSTTGASCDAGLANGWAAYALKIGKGERRTLRALVPLEDSEAGAGAPDGRSAPSGAPDRAGMPAGTLDDARQAWKRALAGGTEIETPDEGVNTLLRSSVSTLLLLADGDAITPGPWTYHQFWFRDAAVMLRALDAFGYHAAARDVLRSYPARQEHSGYFRSQQGEWDSNGQALWTAWQHATLAHDDAMSPGMESALLKGAMWISQKRCREEGGLLPRGLSAEHLGLADIYFWDDWWSVAGLEGYARLCTRRGDESGARRARDEAESLRRAVDGAVAEAMRTRGLGEIPAGPGRGVDSGMIGSCAPWYPLQLLPPGDARMRRTLETLMARYGLRGMFYQGFIHSGMNAYLTLQIAQSWLYAGEREKFWELFSAVVRSASPTLNYPEAIHPLTGGGAMGDGHHGWAAAEVAMALRSAFLNEIWSGERPEIVLLGGVPRAWFMPGTNCAIRHAPVPGGIMSLIVESGDAETRVQVDFEKRDNRGARGWKLRIPEGVSRVTVNGRAAAGVAAENDETVITIVPAEGSTSVVIEYDVMAGEVRSVDPAVGGTISPEIASGRLRRPSQ